MRPFRVPYLAVIVFLTAPLTAQLNRASLTGMISDPTQSVIVEAKIAAEHIETNTTYTTTSTASGNYTLPSLPIGVYRVIAEAPGFKRTVQDNVILAAGATVRLDITLQLGSVPEAVEVTSQASPVQTENARVATTITNELVKGLPLSVSGQVRNVFNLAVIAPEAKTANQFRIGGGRNADWEMLMDGLSLASASTSEAIWLHQRVAEDCAIASAARGNGAGGIGAVLGELRPDESPDGTGWFQISVVQWLGTISGGTSDPASGRSAVAYSDELGFEVSVCEHNGLQPM